MGPVYIDPVAEHIGFAVWHIFPRGQIGIGDLLEIFLRRNFFHGWFSFPCKTVPSRIRLSALTPFERSAFGFVCFLFYQLSAAPASTKKALTLFCAKALAL